MRLDLQAVIEHHVQIHMQFTAECSYRNTFPMLDRVMDVNLYVGSASGGFLWEKVALSA